MSNEYLIINPDIFSEEGVTICFDSRTDLEYRELGIINDSTLLPPDKSRALCNYFIDGRFRKDMIPSSEAGLAKIVTEMQKWISTYREYLYPEELEAVEAHYKEVCKK